MPAQPSWVGEEDHAQIFSRVLGETMVWGPTNIWGTRDLVGTTYKATRIDEENPVLAFGMLNADRVWGNITVQAQAVAAFSNYAQTFGYQPVNSPTWVELFSITGNKYAVLGQSEIIDLTSSIFTWTRRGGGNPYSSLEADNLDTMDHMLTYRLDALTPPSEPPTKISYFLFWEDLHRRGTSPVAEWSSDHDFNDLVIRVDVVVSGETPNVPEPAAACLLACLAAPLLLRRKRSRIAA